MLRSKLMPFLKKIFIETEEKSLVINDRNLIIILYFNTMHVTNNPDYNPTRG